MPKPTITLFGMSRALAFCLELTASWSLITTNTNRPRLLKCKSRTTQRWWRGSVAVESSSGKCVRWQQLGGRHYRRTCTPAARTH